MVTDTGRASSAGTNLISHFGSAAKPFVSEPGQLRLMVSDSRYRRIPGVAAMTAAS
jgi:hypothetical protein